MQTSRLEKISQRFHVLSYESYFHDDIHLKQTVLPRQGVAALTPCEATNRVWRNILQMHLHECRSVGAVVKECHIMSRGDWRPQFTRLAVGCHRAPLKFAHAIWGLSQTIGMLLVFSHCQWRTRGAVDQWVTIPVTSLAQLLAARNTYQWNLAAESSLNKEVRRCCTCLNTVLKSLGAVECWNERVRTARTQVASEKGTDVKRFSAIRFPEIQVHSAS